MGLSVKIDSLANEESRHGNYNYEDEDYKKYFQWYETKVCVPLHSMDGAQAAKSCQPLVKNLRPKNVHCVASSLLL